MKQAVPRSLSEYTDALIEVFQRLVGDELDFLHTLQKVPRGLEGGLGDVAAEVHGDLLPVVLVVVFHRFTAGRAK